MDDLDQKIREHLAETRGPAITREGIEAIIVSTEYQRLGAKDTIAFCVLANAFTVIGRSACVAPENYDQEIGERLALEDAIRQIGRLEAYLLSTRMQLLSDQAAEARIRQLDDELAAGAPVFLSFREVASICHEANRRLAFINGLDGPDWEHAAEDVRDSCEAGVRFHVERPDATAAASHEAWMEARLADGWTFDAAPKDAKRKTHPNLIPFAELPPEEQAKDHLFRGIVHAMRPFIKIPAAVASAEDLPARDAAD